MARILALVALATAFAGCRESMEGRFIYYPSRTQSGDPAGVGLAFRDVTFTAEDGVRLHGWMIPGRTPTTLLYSHGNGGNISDRLSIARILRDQLGVGLFMYDYRGYGRSEGAPSEAGLVRDAVAARAAALREGVAPEHLVYYGRSLGAAVSLDLALAHPPSRLVLEAPFASVRAMANTVIPGAGFLFSNGWDSLAKIPRLRAPLLVLHGDADEVVPYAQGRAVFAAAPEPKTFVTIRGGRHYHMNTEWSEYWEAWRTFLD
ncbi:MAG TPA: alpha/beta hydrolase [Candidatus Limnocylindria bacterium]|nr:alpha/beta hydrolase [Candidatus Limnocylindria bacterium]